MSVGAHIKFNHLRKAYIQFHIIPKVRDFVKNSALAEIWSPSLQSQNSRHYVQTVSGSQCNRSYFNPRLQLLTDSSLLTLSCSYDYLIISEDNVTRRDNTRRLCGDWSDKLKLLRYVSKTAQVRLTFVSDYSHHYSGFKARISMEHGKRIVRNEGKKITSVWKSR